MRVFHVLVLGCVPVLVQDDGKHPPVEQAFQPELDWDNFSVSVPHERIDSLPQLLREVDLRSKQAALSRVWMRMVWRQALAEPLRSTLPQPDAFESTMSVLHNRLRAGIQAHAPLDDIRSGGGGGGGGNNNQANDKYDDRSAAPHMASTRGDVGGMANATSTARRKSDEVPQPMVKSTILSDVAGVETMQRLLTVTLNAST
mmetsp:Transcript_37051/g.86541  ORF Transcript_37051/g.86541 Transcript_37051/m.86541 type:complete len:201 (-) Transcript_37051:137-739(-)